MRPEVLSIAGLRVAPTWRPVTRPFLPPPLRSPRVSPPVGGGDKPGADFTGGAGNPPRLCREGKLELTEAQRLRATAAEGIPEGFRPAEPERVAPRGAEVRGLSPPPPFIPRAPA